jgi:hypothetical protein
LFRTSFADIVGLSDPDSTMAALRQEFGTALADDLARARHERWRRTCRHEPTSAERPTK